MLRFTTRVWCALERETPLQKGTPPLEPPRRPALRQCGGARILAAEQPGSALLERTLDVNKADLVDLIAQKHELSKTMSKAILDDLLQAIIGTVKKGGDVGLIGFGTFKQQSRAARTGFNPSTKQPVKIAAQKVPKFVPGAAFKAAVDPKAAARKAAKAAKAK